MGLLIEFYFDGIEFILERLVYLIVNRVKGLVKRFLL